MKILAIETSCDETAAAIIFKAPQNNYAKVLSNIVASSLALHSKTGGIVPEIAAREQLKFIIPVIEKTINDSKISIQDIDAIAVTVGPGLVGSLLVGIETAKTLAYLWKKPIIPVNHLLGHIYANWLTTKDQRPKTIRFPAAVLLVSGGHTDLVLMRKHGSIKWLGGTRDDAAGEAFDKIGRLLRLPYPGGPAIEKYAKNGDPKAFNFPKPMINSNDLDFSFSGLKTAVLNLVKKGKLPNRHSGKEVPYGTSDSRIRFRPCQNDVISNIAASVQQAIIDVLVAKTLKAAQQYKVKSILLSGGVAANQALRDRFKLEIPFFVPEKWLCTDNGAMIATAAFSNYKPVPWQKITADPELYFE